MQDVTTDYTQQLAYWEKCFPGKGAALMDVLQPFYSWKPELKHALPDLEERAKSAIHWRGVKGVGILQCSLRDSSVASLGDSLGDSLWDQLGDSSLDDDSLWASIWVSLRDSLGDSPVASLRDSPVASLRASLWDSLRDSFIFPCCFILTGEPEEAVKFKPLLDLFLAGNFPIGFDKENNLLVLVAE